MNVQGLSAAQHGFVALGEVRWCEAGRLAGWEIPVKDLVDVQGLPTAGRDVKHTDPFVAKLLQQGATVPGKTATSPYGLVAYCDAVDNPLAPGHSAGGSSAGSAVAVARGLVKVAHGSDGGGSIRVPAAACGVVGYKPAHNPVGAQPVTQGFLGNTLANIAFVADITPRHRPLRVGVLSVPLHAETPVDDAILTKLEAAARRFNAISVPRPYGYEHFAHFRDVFCYRAARIDAPLDEMGAWLREQGRAISRSRFLAAVEAFIRTRDLVAALDVDVLLTPCLSAPPPRTGYFASLAPRDNWEAQTRWTPWASLANMSGAASICVDGLLYTAARPQVNAADLFGMLGSTSTYKA